MTGLVYVQAMAAPFPLPAHADPAALQLSGWQGFADKVAAFHPAFVTSDEYGPAAELAFLLPPSIPVVGFYRKLDPRWGTFGMKTAGLAGSTGVLVTRRTDTACPVPLGTIGRMRGNQTVLSYRVCRVVAPAQGVLLPRP